MLGRLTKRLVRELKERNLKVALAESITCGFLTQQLNNARGTSDILSGSVITYDEEAKKSMLGISAAMLKKYTAESAQVTDAMAKKLPSLVKADIYIAITGLATDGASASASKPKGTVFISVYCKSRLIRLRKRHYGKPSDIKKKATMDAFQLVLKMLVDYDIRNTGD